MVIFEGVDKVGKSTLHKLFDKAVGYEYLTVDRQFLTYIAYAKLYGRKIDLEMLARNLPKDLLVFYIMCETEELERRFKLTNEPSINVAANKNAFMEAMRILESVAKKAKINYKCIIINTTEQHPPTVVKLLVKEARVWHHSLKP